MVDGPCFIKTWTLRVGGVVEKRGPSSYLPSCLEISIISDRPQTSGAYLLKNLELLKSKS